MMNKKLQSIVILAVVLLGALNPIAIGESSSHEDTSRSFVLRVGSVYSMSLDQPQEISPGIIIVRDGKIVAVGHDLDIPTDLPLVDLPDATVVPGFISAASNMTEDHRGDESIGAGYHAIDSFDLYKNYRGVLAGGITTVHLNPGTHRLIAGQGAVIKLGGNHASRILQSQSDLSVNFGDNVYHPPHIVKYHAPSSSDVALPKPIAQRPTSRLGQFLAIDEALTWSEPVEFADYHLAELARAWQSNRPLRVQVQRDADIAGALSFMRRHQRTGYLVGGTQAHHVADQLRNSKVPLVYKLAQGLRGNANDIGYDPEAIEANVNALEQLRGVKLALAIAKDVGTIDLRLAASTAMRAGMTQQEVLASITRIPAEILGIDDRVGSIAPGKDADLAVFWGEPLLTTGYANRVYIGGELVFTAPETDALVVRAETIWVNEHRQIHNGSVLIEDGKISAVGNNVPHPPFAKYIAGGPNSFVTPGFIDAFGHLGLDGDKSSTGTDLSLARLVGVPDVTQRRVARAGITTVMLSPYKASGQGSQISAIKTSGKSREDRIVRGTAAVVFDLFAADPGSIQKKIKKRLEAGKKYLEKWQKYEKELAEWKEKKAKGELTDDKPKKEEVKSEEGEADPITGTWSTTISGGPIPEPQTATMRLKLTGSDIEGRISIPGAPEDVKVVATLDGTHITGIMEIDTGGMGYPEISADIVEEDHIVGVIKFQGLEIDLDAIRTDKEAVEFKVIKRKTRGKDGQPLPPKVNESLEPLRAILEQKIPLVAKVGTPAQIKAFMDTVKEFEIHALLLDGNDAAVHAESLVENNVGVIVPKNALRLRNNKRYHQTDDLARKGVLIAFQSDAEDAARTLPMVGLHAVKSGLSADSALAAFTTQVSRMYRLDDKIGSLETGRHGDLVIFDGHPFEAGSRVKRVIINGEEVQ